MLLLAAILCAATHPGTIDSLLESVRPHLAKLPAPSSPSPAPPGETPLP